MPQKTNLNISPYFDDFDKDDNFYRVLFKPGFPVQARELTTLQSILQNQVENFGSHIFKEGSMVIPGNISYDGEYTSIKINSDYLGIPVTTYVDKLIGKRLRGQTSGVTASVDKFLDISPAEGITDLTLFVGYHSSNESGEIASFDDGEVLIVEEGFTYGNTSVNAGDVVATVVSEDSASIGSNVSIGTGVYFIRGTFVDVTTDKIVLDAYSNNPSFRVGLEIIEELITAKDDDSLYDNAKGFSNFAAPGADRLKISTKLSKKLLTDYDDKTFVELLRIEDGEIKKLQNSSVYSIIKDYFAKRTFEESGDYSLGNFGVSTSEILNDRMSNEGVYFEDQITDQGNTASEDLYAVKLSAGKAYVKGFDVETISTTVVDVEKPRDTRSVSDALVPFEFGTVLRLNNVNGSPFIGVNNNDNIVNLFNQRKTTANATAGSGTQVGRARVYSYGLTDSAYSNASSKFNLSLFDVQTFTELTLNSSVTNAQLPDSSFVEGVSSGASGFANAQGGGSATVNLVQTTGTFIAGEQLKINGTSLVSRSVTSVRTFGIEDVKSVFQDSTAVDSELKSDFSGDLILQKKTAPNFSIADQITISNAGIATVAGKNFVGIKKDSIVRYQTSSLSVPTFNRVSAVAADGLTMTLAATTDVANVCAGPITEGTVNFTIGAPIVKNNGGMYAPLEETSVATVGLSGSNLTVTTQIREKSTNDSGELSLVPGDTGITSSRYETFDADRYSIHYSDGSIEDLTSDQFSLGTDGNVTITGLTASQSSNVTVNATVKKIGISEKRKDYIRSEKININQCRTGVTTSLTGLTQSNFYGTRIEDKEISLNVPDVVKVIAVYEALDINIPVLDKLIFPSGLALDTNSILGEKILGKETGALAQIVTRSSATEVEIVYLNDSKFSIGELVNFEESNINSIISNITIGNYQNVTDHYTLDKGQREEFYDYGRIVKSNDGYTPTRRLLIIFDYYLVPSNDTGDIYTVNSYDPERYKFDIPTLPSEARASDILDVRPRVTAFDPSTSRSPFDFDSRTFGTTGNNPTLVVTPEESSIVDFAYYLPRIDKISLNKDGVFTVTKGTSAVNPKAPTSVDEAMEIATLKLPAYLYNPEDIEITVVDNRRYTMRDIGKIEDRVENLETLTSLTLLELDTKTLQVRDADGLDRFKSGFFVDDFKDVNRTDFDSSDIAVDSRTNTLTTPRDFFSLKPQVALEPSVNINTADFSQNLSLLDSNVQKTGDLITLKYTEKGWIEQPLASRVENVNPFNMIDFTGRIQLTPASDNWTRNVFVSGGTRRITGSFNGSFIETIKISSKPDTHVRSRNVSFVGGGLRPLARHYPFFDSASGIDIAPKLIEIAMSSGVFNIGENVSGFIGGRRIFRARVIQPNHKTGQYNKPATTISLNPYDRSVSLPTTYSASSTVLNVDIEALADEVQGRYFGFVQKGVVLIGNTSGAQATVSDVRLFTDTFGDVGGSIFFRNPLASPPPPLRFKTGTNAYKLTSSSTNAEPLKGSLLISSAETTYRATGIVDTFRQTRVVVRTPPPPPPRPRRRRRRRGGKDPLAQSFTVDETGAFMTSVDLFFANKDEAEKVTIEVRTVELGTPTNQLVDDFSRVTLEPSQINTSTDGTVPTNVKFPSPIYLEPNAEYAVVILAPTTNQYEHWVARMGERTVNTTTLPNAESVLVTKQYVGGSLFKSQNGSIWTPSQFEDLKFKLYKANFTTTTGTAFFYNTPLTPTDSNLPKLNADSIKTLPRRLKVGINTTNTMNAVLQVGRKVSDGTAGRPFGFIDQVGGRVNTLSPSIVGAGYSNGTYSDVPLYTITGNGSNSRATVVVSGGVVSSVSPTTDGNGYVIGDVVGVTTSNMVKGRGAKITVTELDGFDTLYLTGVQGQTFDTGDLVVYDSNTAVSYANTDILSSTVLDSLSEGNIIEVTHHSHGMHASNNIVTLSDIEPNTLSTTLTSELSNNGGSVSVANTSLFGTFEGISTSRGFAKINNEVIFYDSITAGGGGSGSLGIGTRGIDSSLVRSHPNNSEIFPYELNGVSLTKINKQHSMSSNALLNASQDIDKYYLEIDRQDRASGDTLLCFTSDNQVGGDGAVGTRNIQYNTLEPRVNVITPGEGTSLSASIRTTSGTSAGGIEPSFIDQGFEPIELNVDNSLSTPRIVASEVNETTRLTTLPKNRSFTLGIQMNSSDSNLSPVIDTQNMTMIYGRNRINNPISDYTIDGRVNLSSEDPHSSIYVTNRVDLAQPATSLKVLVSSYRHASADFRLLYQLFRTDSSGIETSYQLFPGFNNLNDTDGDGFGDEVIDNTQNNGRSDAFVSASADGQFSEYQFSADNLEQFTGFRIKIVMSGTNEARSPQFKDFRAIALA